MNRNTRVDTTLSAIITEAGAFPPEATTPNKDEQRQSVYPLRVYEGFNYLPTYYGYKSYFGLDSTLDTSGLPSDVVVEDIFVYQTRAFKNILVALTDRGIYIRQNTAWEHLLVLDAPPANQSRFWTKACINQVFFFYYQQSDKVFVLEELIDGAGINMDVFNGMKVTPVREDNLSLDIQLFAFVPTLLNMEGQVGIYKAGGSLGFWDTDDSIAWSAIADYTDFAPSLTTLANTIKLQDQVGKVTSIKEHGDGFIVYCTRSIVYVREDNTALLRFKSTVVLGNVGVAYPREIAVSQPDTTHYAWTSMGLIQIENGEATPIVPDFSDHVKRTKTPQYLEMLNNRYLCVGVMDPNFIPGNVDFSAVTVDPEDITMRGGGSPAIDIPGSVIQGETVCLTIPEVSYEPDWDDPLVSPDPNDPNDPNNPDYPTERIVDSGTKPYHKLAFYRQWLYKGATFNFKKQSLGDKEYYSVDLTPGSTDAAYEAVATKLSASEVPGYEQTQLDKLEERQRKIYEEMYKEDYLKLADKWDKYVEAKSALETGASAYRIAERGVMRTPDYGGHTMSMSEQPYLQDHLTDNNGNFLGPYFIDNNDLYVVDESLTIGSRILDMDALNTQYPELQDFWSYETGAGRYPYCFVLASDTRVSPVTPDYPDAPEVRDGTLVYPISNWTRHVDNVGRDELDPHMVVHPSAIQNYGMQPVGGGKRAYKVAATAQALKVSYTKLERFHRLVRVVPSKITLSTVDAPYIRRDPYSGAEEPAFFQCTIRATRTNSSGELESKTFQTKRYYSLTAMPVVSETHTSDPELGYPEAMNIMYDQWERFWDEYKSVADDVMQAEYDQFLAAAEAEARRFGPDLSYPSMDNRPIYTTPVGAQTYSLTNIQMPYIDIQEEDLTEEQVSVMEDLYGKIPATLPATAVGATAIRQMDEETKRGLIAVHQHYYSQNNSRETLDSSFLVKAAGRVDVPLGTPLGSPVADAYPSRFTEKAKWANRWYELRYEPVLPEDGWPLGDFWPPAETDPNWDVNTPFPPTDTRGWETVQQSVICGTTEDVHIPGVYIPPVTWEGWTIENPPLTWQLQNGSIAPYNPTLFGAYVFDLHLQKWGVFKGNHKHLVDYQPINNYTPGSVSYKNFLIEGGCLTEDLEVALFNDYPTDNYIKYGKYQHVTSDFCAIEEVHVTFRGRSTGIMAVQFSLDGRSPEYAHSVGGWYNEALSHTLNCDIVGRWATITLSGHYDLSGMTVKSHPTGRR